MYIYNILYIYMCICVYNNYIYKRKHIQKNVKKKKK